MAHLAKPSPAFTLILFDLDGVLLDSRRNMEKAWATVQQQLGVKTPFDHYFAEIGLPFSDIMVKLGLAAHAAEIERIYRIASTRHMDLAAWYDGVETMLASAQALELKLGVVTSKDLNRTRGLLAALPADFCTVQTPTPGLRGKPAPDHLLVACAEANTDPAGAVYIGDMIFDYQAAQRANIAYAHAAWGYGAVPARDCRVLAKVPDIITDLCGGDAR